MKHIRDLNQRFIVFIFLFLFLTFSNLFSEEVSFNSADYLVIVHEDLYSTGWKSTLVDLKDDQDLTVGFQLIEDLADALNASVAGSRVAVDNQWIGRERQIGQSGKTVSPEVMISCGISGAIQHQAGMNESAFIIAINKDPGAPIFGIADVGIVGDLYKVVPKLVGELEAAEASETT